MRSEKGFTLIELLIVIAIIAIIAVIALPNLMKSNMQANEANAIDSLNKYVAAQLAFRNAGYGTSDIAAGAPNPNTNAGGKGYCDNFQNLFYGVQVLREGDSGRYAVTTDNLSLIPREMANANPKGDEPVLAGAKETCVTGSIKPSGGKVIHNGYYFVEPKELAGAFDQTFGLLAVPAIAGRTGENYYWVGEKGAVYSAPAPQGQDGKEESAWNINTPSAAERGGALPSAWTPL